MWQSLVRSRKKERKKMIFSKKTIRELFWRLVPVPTPPLPCFVLFTAYAFETWLPSFSLFSLFRLLLLTHFGESPVCEIISPQYFGITRRYMQKKLGGKFYFVTKKTDFSDVFSVFYSQRSVTAAWATRSPWSIICNFSNNDITFGHWFHVFLKIEILCNMPSYYHCA